MRLYSEMAVNHKYGRKPQRYSPPEGAIAALRPFGEKIGLIKDIGRDGLSFDFLPLDTQKGKPVPNQSNGKIDIFWPKKGIYLKKMPCTVVWEDWAQSDKGFRRSICLRRVGVSFQMLAPNQRKRLADFLMECKSK